MAHIGHALLGDGLYGGDKAYIKRHALHCAKVAFKDPVSEEGREFVAPLAEDMHTATAFTFTHKS
jgi:23S rRNA pseudouridine1911/1915/1917 synthase